MKLRSSLIAFLASFVAILSMAAVPHGMMPTWGADGFALTMCNGSAAQITIKRTDPQFEILRMVEKAKRIANGEDIPADDHGKQAENTKCTFAGAAADSCISPAALSVDLANTQQIFPNRTALSIPVLHRLHLPPSTGPPAQL